MKDRTCFRSSGCDVYLIWVIHHRDYYPMYESFNV